MNRMPCRKCSQCGLYHSLAVGTCTGCGTLMSDVTADLIDVDALSMDELGDVDQPVTVYVQKCIRCATLNFTPDNNCRVERCRGCGRLVNRIEPILYALEDEEAVNVDTDTNKKNKRGAVAEVEVQQHVPEAETTYPVNDEGELDTEALFWLERIKERVAGHVNPGSQNIKTKAEASKSREADDDDAADWPEELVGSQKQNAPSEARRSAPASSAKRDITLTAMNYGSLSFTVKAEPCKAYRLGRSANQSRFLSQDDRVGNEHCDLLFKNGDWYVKDNSRNGTAVNDCDIGQNGERMLRNDDKLKLGHEDDSITFLISIKS